MDSAALSFVALVVAPLGAALGAFVVGGRIARLLGGLILIGIVAAALLLTSDVWQHGPQRYPVGSWFAPLGIDLFADGLSCVMLLMTAGVMTAVSIYATRYFARPTPETSATIARPPRNMFWPLWFFLWSALNALFLSADVFNLYVTLELLTLGAIGLVGLAGTREAIQAALRYLLAALGGSLFYLAAVALLYGAYGTLDIASLGRVTTHGQLTTAALVLMIVGLMLKSALFPLHYWLPPAHGSAPAPVSAVLSGLVVKASFYLLMRVWFDVYPRETTLQPGLAVMLLAAGAVIWGSTQAILAERLKMLVAYSTVAQLGYLFMLFGLARVDSDGGFRPWSAGVLMALSHACAKGAFFLAAGTILHVAGNDRIDRLPIVSRRLPVTFFAMGIATFSLMGLPPTASFVAKWILIEESLSQGHAWLAVVLLIGGLLAAIYLFRVLSAAFERPAENEPAVPFHPASRWLEYMTLILAAVGLMLGFAASPVTELLDIGSPWTEKGDSLLFDEPLAAAGHYVQKVECPLLEAAP